MEQNLQEQNITFTSNGFESGTMRANDGGLLVTESGYR